MPPGHRPARALVPAWMWPLLLVREGEHELLGSNTLRSFSLARLQSLPVWTVLSTGPLFLPPLLQRGFPDVFSAGVWVQPFLPQPNKPWKPASFLCRTGWVQEQPCLLPTHQHSTAWPTPSPCPNSPSFFFPLLSFPDEIYLPSLYCKHYSAAR